MSDLIDVSARVWPIVADGVEVCRVVALDDLVVVCHDVHNSTILRDKADVARFMARLTASLPVGDIANLAKTLIEAIQFAFDMSTPDKPRVKREAKSKDEMCNWLKASLGHSSESTVYAKDLRTAWNEYFNATHNADAYWTPHQFHARLQELGYTVKRVTGQGGTGTYIMGVFMHRDRRRIPKVRPAPLPPA
jgi:hypothetical protein